MIDLNKGFNTQLNDYKQNLIDITNDSQLPIGIVYYIFKDVFHEIEILYDKTLKQENASIENNNE